MAIEIVTEEEPDVTPEQGTEVEDSDMEVHGDVETIEEGDVTEIDEGDTNVTVIDGSGDAVEAVVTEQVIEDAVGLALLEERFSALEGRVFAVEMAQEEARRVDAVEAEAIVTEADALEEFEEEEEEDEAEEEEEREPNSAGVHPLFKGWRELFGKDN